MTTKGHQWDKVLTEPTYKRIIERGPWASYARCDECGVDAGKACRDEHDRVATEVCDGRKARPSRSRLERGLLVDPVYVPCQHCGVPTRLWGYAFDSGRTWCHADECRRHKYKTHHRERAARSAAITVPCSVCGVALPQRGRGVAAKDPCCGSDECVRAIKTRRRRARGVQPRWRREPGLIEAVRLKACPWCAAPIVSRASKQGGCGDKICDRGIARMRAAKRRRCKAADQPAAE